MLTIRNTINILILSMTVSLSAFCQEQPLYSQFTFNKFLFNPAVAGSEQVTVIKATAYEQWVGFKGAPKFHSISIDSRVFMDSKKPKRNIRKKFKLFKPGSIGVGVVIFNEKYGSLSHTGIAATYSYHIKLEKQQLSFGISPVLSNRGLKSSDIKLPDDTPDGMLQGDKTRRWMLDFNFGAYILAEDYFAGYSTHHITGSVMQWGGSVENNYRLRRQHYLMGGYKYSISTDLILEPSLLLKIPEGSRMQMDLVLQATIKEFYWCGLTYKSTKTMAIFGGLNYDRYSFTYAFSFSMGKIIRNESYGSHEFMFAVQLGDVSKRYRWLNTY